MLLTEMSCLDSVSLIKNVYMYAPEIGFQYVHDYIFNVYHRDIVPRHYTSSKCASGHLELWTIRMFVQQFVHANRKKIKARHCLYLLPIDSFPKFTTRYDIHNKTYVHIVWNILYYMEMYMYDDYDKEKYLLPKLHRTNHFLNTWHTLT